MYNNNDIYCHFCNSEIRNMNSYARIYRCMQDDEDDNENEKVKKIDQPINQSLFI